MNLQNKTSDPEAAIPVWKRVLLCFWKYRKWRLAVSYNKCAMDAWRGDEYDLYLTLRDRGGKVWDDIFGIKR